MPKTLSKSMGQQMLDIRDLYLEQGGATPIDIDALARFAIVESHNDNNPDGVFIQSEFDFTEDINERKQSGEVYRPGHPW